MKQMSINPATRKHYKKLARLLGLTIAVAGTINLSQPTNGATTEKTGITAKADYSIAAVAVDVPARISFDVWMDNTKLGTHDYRFSRKDDSLQVDSKARFNVKVLFVNVFRYVHDARELWNGHCLAAVRSDTTTNGEVEALNLQFPDGECHGTYSYWDKARLQRPELTNAQTGQRETARLRHLGNAKLPAPGKKPPTAKPPAGIAQYQLTTPSANFLLWYDKLGRCLAMQTKNDGRTITYINRELR